MGLDQAMGQQVQLEVRLRGGAQLGVFGQQGGDQWLVAFGQAGQQLGLRGIDAAQCLGQLRGLGGGKGNGLVAFAVAKDWRDGCDNLGCWVEQWLCVEDFQPGAFTVLGADAEGQAEQGSGHEITSTK